MKVFSYTFFAIWAVTLICYFGIAKRWQWQVLTIASICFYVMSINKIPGILLFVWCVTYTAGSYIARNRTRKGRIAMLACVGACILALFIGRTTNIVALLGNSYFVLKAIGYVIDVYREDVNENNILKYLLYLIYWPGILEGPFNRIKDFDMHFNEIIEFDYLNLTHGIQRFIWGVFKKLVIAERLELIVTAVLNEPGGKGGRYILLGIIAYAIQIYADFSGFIDMMLGLSMTFGIELPENFKQPYFAKSIPEFWRRWHITLGLWFRDYVMFPFTSNSVVKRISKALRKKNKNVGKLIPLLVGTCLVWILTGLWHGFSKNYFVWGLYYAVVMCISQIYNEFCKKGKKEKKTIFADVCRIIRTIILVLIADSVICVQGLVNVKEVWQELLLNFRGGTFANLLSNGIEIKDFIYIFIGCLMIFFISVAKEQGVSVQEKLDGAPLVIRWGVYYILIFSILLLGLYGSQYDASQFLYMQF